MSITWHSDWEAGLLSGALERQSNLLHIPFFTNTSIALRAGASYNLQHSHVY